jgi:antitoxin component HigA of HigAB toxin-antitoxin module
MKLSRFFTCLLALVLATGATVSLAQAEPTVDQIYQAANAGDMRKAQGMIDQVLRNHPNSAKAHYVKAELAARELDAATARQSLARAEQLAPGLPFARPEAVQALRTQVDRLGRTPAPTAATRDARGDTRQLGNTAAAPPAREAPQPSFPWGLLAIGAVVVFGVMAFLRRRAAAAGAGHGGMHGMPGGMPPGSPYGPNAPHGGAVGRAGFPPAGYPPGAYPPGSYPPGSYPPGSYPPGSYPPGAYPHQATQGGMGSSIGRGLAAGVALGAGAAVAHEVGRRMFDQGPQNSPLAGPNPDGGFVDPSGLDGMANADMGGQNFGISDPGSWDDAGGGFDGGVGGGDWNN